MGKPVRDTIHAETVILQRELLNDRIEEIIRKPD